MSATYVVGSYPAGRPLVPGDRVADVLNCLVSGAPNLYAAAQFSPKDEGRLLECTDATWCAQQVVNGSNQSRAVGNAIAVYAKRFSRDVGKTTDLSRSLTAITVLGCESVRRAVLGNGMGGEVPNRLRSAITVGLLEQRHAAAVVLSRYAIDVTKDCYRVRYDGGMLLGAMSALTEVMLALNSGRSELGRRYYRLMDSTLRSIKNVGEYVGHNEVSARAMMSLRTLSRAGQVADIEVGIFAAVRAIAAEPKPLPCGRVEPFGAIRGNPFFESALENLMS